MTMSTSAAGIACCGNCGSELEVRCTGGCAEPDIVPRENYIATMKKPRDHERSQIKEERPGLCSWQGGGCDQPVAPRLPGQTRTPKKCPKHLEMVRQYERNRVAKQAAKGAIAV